MMSLTYFIQERMHSDVIRLFIQLQKIMKTEIFNMELKPCLYTQTNVLTFLLIFLVGPGRKNCHFIQQACTDQLSDAHSKTVPPKMVDIVSHCVCVCIQPKLENIVTIF